MPSIKHFDLTYEALNEEGTFSEGDTVTGTVTLTLAKDIKVKDLFVKAKADANVSWSEGTGDNRRTYSAHRRYFKIKECFVKNSDKDTELTKGVHNFKFTITLPQEEMPSSFKAIHGRVVYALEAKLTRSWRMPSRVQKVICFLSKSLIHSHPVACPQSGSVNKDMGIFSKGQVQMSATLNKNICSPGDFLSAVAKINNSTSKTMRPKFSLHQKTVYHASGHIKISDKSLCKGLGETIAVNTEEVASCQLKIPDDDTMYSVQNCDILSNSYYLKVYLDISFAIDPEVVFPLVIIPAALARVQAVGPVGPYPAMAIGGPSYSDFPPPAFPVEPAAPVAYGYSTPYPAPPANVTSGYNNQWPQQPVPYSFPAPTFPPSSVPYETPSAPPQFQQGEAPPSYVATYPPTQHNSG